MKSMVKQVEELVIQLSEKYGFDKAEALEFIMPAGEAVRGRPSKPKKKVINKTEMVEDIIKTIMDEGCAAVTNAEAVPAQAEPVIVAAVVESAPIKKKAAPKKKKAEAAAVEAVSLVVPETVAALIALESPVEAQAEPIIVAAVDAPKEKKKAAPRKKKAEAVVTEAVVVETAVVEAVAVVAQAEPVIVASEGGLKGDTPLKKKAAPKKKKAEAEAATEVAVVAQAAPVASESGVSAYTVEEGEKTARAVAALMEATKEAAKQKKKAAPKKKKAEAEAAVVEAVAVVAQAEPVTVASEGGLKGDTPLKKKAAPKKKAEAVVAVVEAPKPVPVVVVEAPKPVVAPVGLTGVSLAEEGGALGGSPPTSSDEESTAVKGWICKETGKAYLKSCDDNCEEDDCECCGTVYDEETQDQIGHWDGTTIVLAAEDEEEGEDIDWP